jgi:nucleotide-binding universal stress UspA family protein
VQNPFRSEADAYRFVWLTLGYFAVIVVASLINRWLGVAAFVVESLAVLWLLFFRGEREQPERQAAPPSPEGEHRILVVANETISGQELLETIQQKSAGVQERVLLVCPALNSPLRHWVSDEDDARAAAQARLDTSLASLQAAGIDARGEIGDGDPLQAIEDALRTFAPDELIISTHPVGRSHWLERGVVERAKERFDLPVTHVVVDLGARA